jgi:hypothetical protein
MNVKVLRAYARVYAAALDEVLPALSAVTGQPAGLRFNMPNGLQLAAVGNILVVAGAEDVLAPFRATQATLVVDDLQECQAVLSAEGARVIRGPQQVPTGRNLTAILAGGTQLEFVEWGLDQRAKEGLADSGLSG